MKYKVKFWNDSLKEFQRLEYPYLETALLTAHTISRKFKIPVYIIDGKLTNTLVVGLN